MSPIAAGLGYLHDQGKADIRREQEMDRLFDSVRHYTLRGIPDISEEWANIDKLQYVDDPELRRKKLKELHDRIRFWKEYGTESDHLWGQFAESAKHRARSWAAAGTLGSMTGLGLMGMGIYGKHLSKTDRDTA
jgi:hypothetical protein